jgi:hypothetical protein
MRDGSAGVHPEFGAHVSHPLTELGARTFATHLLGATADRWDEACGGAGTSAKAVEDALARRLAK